MHHRMRHGFLIALCGATLAGSGAASTPAASADLRVFTSAAPAEAEKLLAEKFAQATGHRVSFTVGTVAEIQSKVSGAEKPDIVVLPAPAIEALEKKGALVAGSRLELARVGIGVAVRAGARKPDIATPEAVRNALLAASSICRL
jgi:molybdate transport system substrate-binding protein